MCHINFEANDVVEWLSFQTNSPLDALILEARQNIPAPVLGNACTKGGIEVRDAEEPAASTELRQMSPCLHHGSAQSLVGLGFDCELPSTQLGVGSGRGKSRSLSVPTLLFKSHSAGHVAGLIPEVQLPGVAQRGWLRNLVRASTITVSRTRKNVSRQADENANIGAVKTGRDFQQHDHISPASSGGAMSSPSATSVDSMSDTEFEPSPVPSIEQLPPILSQSRLQDNTTVRLKALRGSKEVVFGQKSFFEVLVIVGESVDLPLHLDLENG
ncbi:hypothetical protein B0H14DRAFT_2597301 [Mycena olivaceomarginata]|nr:hypothetical protein B0H14DRAFT_2597301 [Mycena olivaceomarginata]